MSCTALDVKAYFLGELTGAAKDAARLHLDGCAECREEYDQLGAVHSALRALPDEEVPRRISFVSDRIFEPRWWHAIWRSGPAMAFASALVLAAAILGHGFASRPAAASAMASSA